MSSDQSNKDQSNNKSSKFSENYRQVLSIRRKLTKNQGVHNASYMAAAGFKYTGDGDTARCDDCGLEVSQWTLDMNPFTVHSERSPQCLFIRPLIPSQKAPAPFSSSLAAGARSESLLNQRENHSQSQTTAGTNVVNLPNTLLETDILQQVRKRTFSHWPQRTIPSSAQMIEAGFFNCNRGDRVICIYCDLICQHWTPHTDDPCAVHRILSHNCIYVKAKLICRAVSSTIILNEDVTDAAANSHSATINTLDSLRSNNIVLTAACNPAYAEIPKRQASFATWPNENLPPVDDLVQAGFFYAGAKTIVTCFYCNGSLKKWDPNDNPIVEHALLFPHCAYAKQLFGDELYKKTQESKRPRQERGRSRERRQTTGSRDRTDTSLITNSRRLLILDKSTSAQLVIARLDLPVSQRLLDRNFELSIIKRCWEDQVRLKHDDFESDCDLYIACLILQKQIQQDDDKEENEARVREQISIDSNTAQSVPNRTDIEMTVSSKSRATDVQSETKTIKPTTVNINDQDRPANSTLSYPCIICSREEKRLACIPCGYLVTCIPCGYSILSCPICQREIDAFVRIYI